jgi:hypothetical protein
MGSGGPQDPASQSRGQVRVRAPRPPGATELRGALAGGGPGVVLPAPLDGGGLDECWMHDALLGLRSCWLQLRRWLARNIIASRAAQIRGKAIASLPQASTLAYVFESMYSIFETSAIPGN